MGVDTSRWSHLADFVGQSDMYNIASGCLLPLEPMSVDTSRWSHLADFVGHSMVHCRVSFYCRVYIYLHYGRNIHTISVLTVGIINVFCRSPNYTATLCIINRMSVYIKRNNLQLELIPYVYSKMFVTLPCSRYFCEATYSPRKFRTQTTSAPFLTV